MWTVLFIVILATKCGYEAARYRHDGEGDPVLLFLGCAVVMVKVLELGY